MATIPWRENIEVPIYLDARFLAWLPLSPFFALSPFIAPAHYFSVAYPLLQDFQTRDGRPIVSDMKVLSYLRDKGDIEVYPDGQSPKCVISVR